jgi:hypothetical protein
MKKTGYRLNLGIDTAEMHCFAKIARATGQRPISLEIDSFAGDGNDVLHLSKGKLNTASGARQYSQRCSARSATRAVLPCECRFPAMA